MSKDKTDKVAFEKRAWKYLRKNPSLIIAVVSAIVTLTSAIMSFSCRLATVTFLRYWNIDTLYAAYKVPNLGSIFAISFIFLLCGTISMFVVKNTVSKFIHNTTTGRCCNQVFRILSHRINKEDKELKSMYAEFWNDKRASADDRVHLARLDARRMSIYLQKELIQKARKLEKILFWKEICEGVFEILVVWGLVAILFWIILAALTDIVNFVMVTILSALCMIEFIAMALLGSVSQLKVSGKKAVETKLDKAIENNNNTLSFVDEIKEDEEKIFKSERFEFSITSWKRFFLMYIYIIVVLVIAAALSGREMAKDKRIFECLVTPKKTEVVIFCNENFYILEEAEINGNSITINTSNQHILKSDDISLEKMTFDTVVKKQGGHHEPR